MKKFLFYFLTLLAFVACSDEERDNGIPQSEGKSAALNTSANFIKLFDDSTNVAGVLRITAQAPSIELKWNVPTGCNIDTTLTKLELSKGMTDLPIKWAGMLSDSIYGPSNMAFNAGVLITAGDYSKYVNLIWADEIDSTKIANHPVILTRSADTPLPKAEALTVDPEMVKLDINNRDLIPVTVEFLKTSGPVVSFAKGGSWDDDLLTTDVPSSSFATPLTFNVGWKEGAVPEKEFATYISAKLSSTIIKYVYIVYLEGEPPVFVYDSCVPAAGVKLPAVGAVVAIYALTNQEWTISSEQSIVGSKVGEAGPSGLKTLALAIDDNPLYEERDVVVTVTPAAGGAPVTLNFKQQPRTVTLSVTNIDPAPGFNIPALGSDIDVTVLTNQGWWIECFGKRTDFSESKLTGKITIPANPGTTKREITVNVGHGSTIDSTFVYSQLVGDNLDFVSISPGSKIPVSGGNYTLTFEGDYVGGVLVEAFADGVADAIAVSNVTYNKKSQVQIPANNESIYKRTITFKYKKEGSGDWKIAVTKEQDGTEVTPNAILPSGDIPASGGIYSCSFSGVYSGTIYFRATAGGTEIARSEGKIGKTINLPIPENESNAQRTVVFSYSGNGINWIDITEDIRIQHVDVAIEGGNTTVNGFGDEEIINGGIEL